MAIRASSGYGDPNIRRPFSQNLCQLEISDEPSSTVWRLRSILGLKQEDVSRTQVTVKDFVVNQELVACKSLVNAYTTDRR